MHYVVPASFHHLIMLPSNLLKYLSAGLMVVLFILCCNQIFFSRTSVLRFEIRDHSLALRDHKCVTLLHLSFDFKLSSLPLILIMSFLLLNNSLMRSSSFSHSYSHLFSVCGL